MGGVVSWNETKVNPDSEGFGKALLPPTEAAKAMMSSLEPQTTAWLDVTKSDEGLCVAWNSARYLLTTEQARRMVETLSSLLADLPKKEATK